jgi:glucokinase
MSSDLAIGVDIGGTKIAFVLVDNNGKVLGTHQVATGASDGVTAVVERIAQGVRLLLNQAGRPVAGVGMGSPGLIDPVSGVVHDAVNLGWKDVPLCKLVQEHLGGAIPVFLQKDTNAGALGELYFGAAQGCRDFVYIAVGTGLGMGAVVNGQLVVGAHFYATDIGHLVGVPKGRACACGQQGCIERYIAGPGLVAAVHEYRARYPQSGLAQIAEPTTADILEAARAGDPLARAVMDEAGEWLGVTLAYCGAMLNPALFVVGGGLGMAAADLLLERAEETFHQRVLPPIYEKSPVVRGQVTSSAIGAACLAWYGNQV